ncbi:MAG: class C sortase [Suipraeoptans sp.]
MKKGRVNRRRKNKTSNNKRSKRKNIGLIIGIIILISGVFLIALPFIFQLWYDYEAAKSIEVFEEQYDDSTDPRLEELYESGQDKLKDPFAYEEAGFDLSPYGIEENMIGSVVIPKIDVTLPIYLGASEENMTKGATLLTYTSMPIGGDNTNAVIAAHRGYYKAEMFRHIDKIEVGDIFYIRNFREELVYRVIDIQIIIPSDIEKVLIQEGNDMVTLLTCHPYGQNTRRYIVYGERIE